jgi:hypothetical protein
MLFWKEVVAVESFCISWVSDLTQMAGFQESKAIVSG